MADQQGAMLRQLQELNKSIDALEKIVATTEGVQALSTTLAALQVQLKELQNDSREWQKDWGNLTNTLKRRTSLEFTDEGLGLHATRVAAGLAAVTETLQAMAGHQAEIMTRLERIEQLVTPPAPEPTE